MKYAIERIKGLQILDSRGNPTVRAWVELTGGAVGVASVPSGASTGAHEALELRDGGSSYGGKGVQAAVRQINGAIYEALRGMDALNQEAVDRAMRDINGLGANASLAVSMACARAAANAVHLPLYRYLGGVNARKWPMPMMNLINGGAHAGNNLDIQEFMIRPIGANSFPRALEMGADVYRALGAVLKERGLSRAVGDEGGYAPDLESDEQALELLVEAIERADYRPGADVTLALDLAASEWAADGGYKMPKSNQFLSRDDLIRHIGRLVGLYPIDSVEDPLGEEDFEGFQLLTEKFAGRTQVVGDDLFTTNPDRLSRGLALHCASAILIKPNQIGTVSQTLETVRMAAQGGWKTVLSHRSGETEDAFLSDLAVAVNAGQIKTGAPARSDRVSKYNRLLEIFQIDMA